MALERAQMVLHMRHDRLARYLDAERGESEQLFVVSEHHTPLEEYAVKDVVPILRDVVEAVEALHARRLVHGQLSSEAVLVRRDGRALLADWGVSYLTAHGALLPFSTVADRVRAPEALALGPHGALAASDVWALGLLIVRAVHGVHLLESLNLGAPLEALDALLRLGPSAAQDRVDAALAVLPESPLNEVAGQCLRVEADRRPLASELRRHRALQCDVASAVDVVPLLSFEERYRVWAVRGRVQAAFAEVRGSVPAIERVPRAPIRASRAAAVGRPVHWFVEALETDSTLVPRPPRVLVNLSRELERADGGIALQQAENMARLLRADGPSARSDLLREARRGVPAALRGRVWYAVLGAEGVDVDRYARIDVDVEGASDRQIALDVPRCHQYHPFLASPTGRRALRRVLKAWVAANSRLAYWQGIDSLAAAFLVLHQDHEPRAFACLQRLVALSLGRFFQPADTEPLQRHLLQYRQLLAFHDPTLFVHLHREEFHPELYAIPWFLTLFAHVFTLERVFAIWDVLLTHPPPFVLLFAVALMRHIRDRLLRLAFNDFILFFSDFPDVDVAAVLRAALALYDTTPASLYLPREPPSVADDARWWETPRPLDQAKAELAPRLSLEDIVSAEPKPYIVDTRTQDDFDAGHFPGSVRGRPTAVAISAAAQCRMVVIVGDRNGAQPFADDLVERAIPKVTLLNGGVDVILSDAPKLLQRS